jgi:hypothetical protein
MLGTGTILLSLDDVGMNRCVNALFEGSTGLRACDITGLTDLEALRCCRWKESRKLLENKEKGDVLMLRACGKLLHWRPPGITHRVTHRIAHPITPKFLVWVL